MNKYMIIFTILSAVIILVLFVYSSTVEAEAPTEELTEADAKCKIVECTTLYDVPLTDELQIFIHEMCAEYGVDFKLVLAIISVESSFRPNAYNETTDCCGLMQINRINLPVLREKLGVTDLFNAYENVIGGIYLLKDAFNYDGDTEHALMIYNNGLRGAKQLLYRGIHSTEYSRKVLAVRDSFTVRERIYEETF
ncbi:MAG: transglycosylase SLT domain-containing protein [Clostridia bacterium]|nr:transglycosylase SLT domain-containing protein [Clostridia bacterium]